MGRSLLMDLPDIQQLSIYCPTYLKDASLVVSDLVVSDLIVFKNFIQIFCRSDTTWIEFTGQEQLSCYTGRV